MAHHNGHSFAAWGACATARLQRCIADIDGDIDSDIDRYIDGDIDSYIDGTTAASDLALLLASWSQ